MEFPCRLSLEWKSNWSWQERLSISEDLSLAPYHSWSFYFSLYCSGNKSCAFTVHLCCLDEEYLKNVVDRAISVLTFKVSKKIIQFPSRYHKTFSILQKQLDILKFLLFPSPKHKDLFHLDQTSGGFLFVHLSTDLTRRCTNVFSTWWR